MTWEPLGLEEQTANLLRFWTWLMEARTASVEAGHTFRAYCYSASAENSYLRTLGLTAGVLDQVEEFVASESWVDILRVFDSQLITGGPSGLKTVASLAGLSWQVDDPGGAESMLRYDVAVGSSSVAEREEARRWLLTYNRGDVEATRVIRVAGQGLGFDPLDRVPNLQWSSGGTRPGARRQTKKEGLVAWGTPSKRRGPPRPWPERPLG